jgi:hypothetical protein
MATAIATDRLATRRKILMYLHDPADADVLQSAKSGLTTTTWTALAGYGSFQACAMFKEGTSMILLAIYAATSAAGANAVQEHRTFVSQPRGD